MNALAEQDQLALEAQLADVVAILMESPDDALPDATVQAYAERIGNLRHQAEALQLHDFSLACQLFQQRLLTDPEQVANNRELLEEWPMLAIGYLAEPDDGAQLDALLHNVQSEAWGEPLDLTIAQAATDSEDSAFTSASDDQFNTENLISENEEATFTSASDNQFNTKNLISEQEEGAFTATSDDQFNSENLISEQEKDTFALRSDKVNDDESDTIIELDDTDSSSLDTTATLQADIAGLLEILEPAIDDSSPAILNPILKQFSEQLHLISGHAAESGFLEFYDLCLLFAGHLSQLSARDDNCTPDELALLEEWPALAMAYLDQPDNPDFAQALFEHMNSEIWRQPLATEEANILHSILAQADTAFSEPDPHADISTQETEISSLWAETAVDESTPDQDTLIETAGLQDADSLPDQSEQTTFESPPIQKEIPPEDSLPEEPLLTEPSSVAEEALPTELLNSEQIDLGSAHTISSDLLEILYAELAEIAESGEHNLTIAQTPASTSEQRQHALEEYTEELERLSMAAESIGLQGLAQFCSLLHANLDAFTAREQTLSAAETELLRAWQQPILNYLQLIGAEQPSRQLVAFMQQPGWLLPLDDDESTKLLQALLNPTPSLEDFGEAEQRPTESQPEDVSLQVPADTNQELLDSLLQELPNQTSEFTAAIQKLYEGRGNQDDMAAAQRIAHTLKGAGNTVGVAGIANITHHVEDVLIALSKEHSLPTRDLASVLMDSADCLESMTEHLLGLSEPPQHAQSVLQAVLDLANRIDHEGVPKVLADDRAITMPAAPKPQVATVDDTSSTPESTTVPMVRVPAPLIDELLRLVGENIILTGQIEERIHAQAEQSRIIRAQNQDLQQLVNELEQLVDVQGVGLPSVTGSSGSTGDFDPLEMDQYNELHTVTRRLVEAVADTNAIDESINDNFSELDTLLSAQSQVHRDSQEAVMRTRMVAIQTVVPRLQRTVRQTGRLTDKEVELDIIGSNTLIDSNLLSNMIDPLMHVLRNAIDHGIENPAGRAANNKPSTGQIKLSFLREGNSIVVRCQDDGKGLDLASIRATAQQRGLILPNQTLHDDELSRLILRPGFSTRTQATQVSGRGIGLDVVYKEILELKGSLAIHSEPGAGCTIEMRLPVTLISTHALLVRCKEDIFAVAERGIEQLVHATTGQVVKTDTGFIYQLDEQEYEILQLESLLNLPLASTEAELLERPALLVRDETGTIKAIMVEEMIDSRDLVVKPMGRYAPAISGILGATILGDASIIPVLDMPELIRSEKNVLQTDSSAWVEQAAAVRPKILVVDDSLSVRRTMQQLIGDAGFEVLTARDGLEAVAVLNSEQPSVMLVDLEMPRMNGLELTQHARSQAATRELPIIMITSRSATKHRQEAEAVGVSAYLTKPIADEELLGHLNRMIAA